MKRRIIAVLSAAALTFTIGIAAAPAASADGHLGASYVALGDSMASGNGNLPYVDPVCLQSARSYPKLLAAATGRDLVSAACTAATTDQVAMQLGQLQLDGDIGPGTELVTLTAGINDLGWQQALAVCAAPGMEAQCALAVQAMAAAGATVPGKIYGLLMGIRAAAPNAVIVVTGYPKLFGTVTKSCSIGNLGGSSVKLPASLTVMANGALDGAVDDPFPPGSDPMPGLNDAIAGATWLFASTDPVGTLFVDVDPAFQTHRLCDTGDRWISGLIRGVPVDRGLHPNAAGLQAFAATIGAALVP
ncbi:SGNH/GDSL hydrolase family protein [Microbacterium sp. 2FI]|uniref:SGNH/GDSL hydrolase family protein n=1 Tax=Microbacterium sp. 2FI TaxID=2502193 RepID=UPI0014854EE7|nr:SGNH/GDSL hydrolase family protein [Microbacterium sp. 2FI]